MAPSIFLDRASVPDEAALHGALGRTLPLWGDLRGVLAEEYGPVGEKWSYAGKAHGWSLQVKGRSKKTLLYLVPGHGGFTVSFALGRAAVTAARDAGLRPALLERIDDAPQYPEGKAVRIEVRTRRDLADVRELIALRMAS